ncbi:MAG: hypothetical protein ABI590_02175, partial [Ilumatobacteraceae bacterium]
RSESNTLRYRQFDEDLLFRVAVEISTLDIAVAVIASVTVGASLQISTPVPLNFDSIVNTIVESDEALIGRISQAKFSRLRIPGNGNMDIETAAHLAGVVVDRSMVVRNGRIELLHWLREQSVSECQHRYGLIRPH